MFIIPLIVVFLVMLGALGQSFFMWFINIIYIRYFIQARPTKLDILYIYEFFIEILFMVYSILLIILSIYDFKYLDDDIDLRMKTGYVVCYF